MVTALTHAKQSLLAIGVTCTMVGAAIAQSGTPPEPLGEVGDVYVTDSSDDVIYRIIDLNQDGAGNGAGEVTVFYDDNLGAVQFGNNSNLSLGPSGDLFVADSAEDRIFRLIDLNGDGNANGPLEATVFFDGDPTVNASGIEMVSPAGVCVGADYVVWVADSNTLSAGVDGILRLADLNFDGDANDVGEATRVYTPPTGTVVADSIPSDVIVGLDGRLYYVESGSTGFYAKGIYKLDDADQNGFIDPSTEVSLYFTPPSGPNTAFLWTITQDSSGYLYITDTGNNIVWRLRDDNGDGTITNATEASALLTLPSPSFLWEVNVAGNGAVLMVEDQAPDQILYGKDDNGDGVIDPLSEVSLYYDQQLSGVKINNPRGLAWEREPSLVIPAVASLGTTVNGTVAATVGDIVQVFFSTSAIGPIPIPPFGDLEIGVLAPDLFGLLSLSVVPSLGPLSFPIFVPNDPALAGTTFAFQAFVGKPDRMQLSNVRELMIL
jgi:hypothetical protein